MKAAAWLDCLNMILWIVTWILGTVWCCTAKRSTRRTDIPDGGDVGTGNESQNTGKGVAKSAKDGEVSSDIEDKEENGGNKMMNEGWESDVHSLKTVSEDAKELPPMYSSL